MTVAGLQGAYTIDSGDHVVAQHCIDEPVGGGGVDG